MMRNILALAVNDFVAALKNKTIYLILFIPFFVFLCLKLIDPTEVNPGPIKIGLIEPQVYGANILQSLGMVLTLTATLCLHLLGQFGVVHLFDYIALIAVGGFCFSSYGVLLGFLCRSQASARTLGVVFYLPHLLPSALSDFSQQLTAVSPLLPSYQFYEPLKSILLEEGRLINMPFAGGYLVLVGGLSLYLSYLLMKKRWLMG